MTDARAHLSATTRRGLLAGTGVVAGVAAVGAAPAAARASGGGGEVASDDWPRGPGDRIRPQRANAELRGIIDGIDPRRIEATIRKLVSFGTRHTLSTQTDPARGIGAARDWIKSEMDSYAATSGGRMTVELQSFVVPAGSVRIPTDTVLTNVVATLKGDVEPNRTYVVTGHYDSRITDILNFTDDAPGADDDASGVAVTMELARVMATHHSRATIIFAPVAGEEQNLYGSTYLANQLKSAGVDVQGMFTNDIVGSSRADDGSRDRTSVRLFAQGPPPSEDADAPCPPADPRGRERLAGAGSRPVRHGGGRADDDGHGHPGDLPPRPLPARRATTPGSSPRASRPRGSPSRPRTSPTSTRTCGSRTASSSATCRSSATSTTSRAWPG